MKWLIKVLSPYFNQKKYMITVEPAHAIFVFVTWLSNEGSCEPVSMLKRFRAFTACMNKKKSMNVGEIWG